MKVNVGCVVVGEFWRAGVPGVLQTSLGYFSVPGSESTHAVGLLDDLVGALRELRIPHL